MEKGKEIEQGIGAEQAQAAETNAKGEFYDWLETMMVSLTVLMVMFTFVIGTVVVKGQSMQPTLMDEERLLILPTYYKIQFQDILVIHRENDTPLVKRVIATEGQTVDINFETGIVSVDGKELDEPYAAAPATVYFADSFLEFPAKVPEGHVFVMGDNRNNSLDSRDKRVGMIQEDQVFGKVIFRVFPFDKLSKVQ